MPARRPLMPALRQALGLEQKALSFSRDMSHMFASTTTLGRRDSAAGWDMETVVADGYERVVWVFKAVEVIAGNAAKLPFQIMAPDEEEVEKHPLLKAMNKKANPHETGYQFRKRLSQQILLSKKGAFVEVTKNRMGLVTRLDLLPPDRVRIVPSDSGDYVECFEYTRYDGNVRPLAPEQVRWIRSPHPIDPFSGVTPLEAAGLSVELDRLARQYNVSFINRDGRPGGILGVDADGIDETELDRIQARLKPGAQYAGQISAIGTGPGGITYIDTASRPRDMAYETTSEKAKLEILGAFGVPLSLAGDASGRTFDNAEQEEYNFWQDPMLPHLALISAAFDGDVEEDHDCGFDTSEVEALELPARRRRDEMRTEFDKGLRSVDEYRKNTPDLDPIDNPQSRALWLSPAKAPVPARPEDSEALGLENPDAPAAMDEADPAAPAPTAQEVVAQALAEGGHAGDEGQAVDGLGSAAVDAARSEMVVPVDSLGAGAVLDARMEGKVLRVIDDAPPVAAPGSYDPGEEDLQRVELAVTAALDAMLARQAGVITARLENPATRKGTAYWVPADDADTRGGEEPIDAGRVIDAERWAGELQQTLYPITTPAAQESAGGLLQALVAAGVLTAAAAGTAQVIGRANPLPSPDQLVAVAAQASIEPVMLAMAIAESALREWLRDREDDLTRMMVQDQLPLPDLVEAVRRVWGEKARPFAESLAVSIAQTTVGGGREAAAEAVHGPRGPLVDHDPRTMWRIWRCRQDERVRHTHIEADGQVRPLGDMFDVGGFQLRYPCDPLGPASQTRWCRCWLRYEWASDAEFVLAVG